MSQKKYNLESWIDSRVEVRPSHIHGKGLFARDSINEDEVVIIWGGTLFSVADFDRGQVRREDAVPIAEGVFMGSRVDEPISMDAFLNHSCDPNLWPLDEVTLVARRNIKKDEEVTTDYAMWMDEEVWTLDPAWHVIQCHCNSPLCRGRVTGNDWRLESLQKRYREHVSPYIRERISRLKQPKSL